jgi:hypothetical protein
MSALGGKADMTFCGGLLSPLATREGRGYSFPSQEAKGNNVMSVVIEEAEEILSWDVSDEALEIAGAAGQEMAGAYTLQFCTTSRDCAS